MRDLAMVGRTLVSGPARHGTALAVGVKFRKAATRVVAFLSQFFGDRRSRGEAIGRSKAAIVSRPLLPSSKLPTRRLVPAASFMRPFVVLAGVLAFPLGIPPRVPVKRKVQEKLKIY